MLVLHIVGCLSQWCCCG